MIVYAIQHTPSGFFLPQRKSRKGFTSDEPVKDCIPRLFKQRRHAQCALNYWLQGMTGWEYVKGNFEMPGGDEIVTHAVPSRKKEEMAVVALAVVHPAKITMMNLLESGV